ncbi:general secretion pathway protein GspE [Melittangium boletus]|uniref:ATPase n=1 Tax=Melittangium boletus DSM 14713 TaxID=1294270 RepID=A0A250IUC0_9BACT|nr:general secretion pathway protein GspE [Melittangium boletus]ATB34526.1 ATPase [Melittangium boletus DSM 14713]
MRKKIGELLLESGAVNPEQIRTALGQQRSRGHSQRLGSVIVTLGFASSTEVARALARQANLPFVQLSEIPASVRALVPIDFQVEHRVVPFQLEREGRSERLHVAVDDPSDLSLVDELSFQLNKPIRVHVASEDDLDHALDLISGRVVAGVVLEDDSGAPMELEHGSETPSELPLMEWDLPTGQPPRADDIDDSSHRSSTRSALKPKPPAPPPFSDDDEITLITPKHAQKGRAATPPPPPPPQESEEVLDELLGEPDDEETPLPVAQPSKKGVPVVVFGGAAKGAPQPTPRPELPDISEEDLKVLEDIERMADGAEAELHTEKVKPARMVASLIRLLIRKRLIREEEFLEELSRK